MKKKHWIILIIITALLALGVALYFWLRPTLFHAEIIDPRTLHACPAHQTMITGLWHQDGHLFYRFNEDGTGYTWDTDDDVSEEEASPFGWEAYDKAVMLSHRMLLRGVVPRYYQIDALNAFDFRFHDAYHAYTLEKVEEDQPLADEKSGTPEEE